MKDWIIEKVQDFYNLLIDGLLYVGLTLMDMILGAMASIVESIPAPEFIEGFNLNNYIPDEILWFLYMSEFDTCLGIITAGITFYFFRRLLTLGIW